ncbi:hypothetical protein [Flavobacterium phycosphaerae]|uniref:hypothetical protein n=1 Tax=Flavobacterium phycosphaerae TaxID=2697515 RepID=UPI00138AD5F0|nr:hypothetical protein [Flavobacterium phycosphaerae]
MKNGFIGALKFFIKWSAYIIATINIVKYAIDQFEAIEMPKSEDFKETQTEDVQHEIVAEAVQGNEELPQ